MIFPASLSTAKSIAAVCGEFVLSHFKDSFKACGSTEKSFRRSLKPT